MPPVKKPIVQIYEIQTPEEAEGMIEDGVDHIGSVVLSSAQWKNPVLFETVRLVQRSGKVSSLIPLFSGRDDIRRIIDYYQPDIIHFCETPVLRTSPAEACHSLLVNQQMVREDYPSLKIMRSVPIGRSGQAEAVPTLAWADKLEAFCDYFLTDTLLMPKTSGPAAQPVDGFVGITGETCDWPIARKLVLQARIPVILAGGLSPENVSEGIGAVAPAGVDSCTATNRLDSEGQPIRFCKDRARVRQFVRAAQLGM